MLGLPLPFLKTDYRARLPVAKFCINRRYVVVEFKKEVVMNLMKKVFKKKCEFIDSVIDDNYVMQNYFPDRYHAPLKIFIYIWIFRAFRLDYDSWLAFKCFKICNDIDKKISRHINGFKRESKVQDWLCDHISKSLDKWVEKCDREAGREHHKFFN